MAMIDDLKKGSVDALALGLGVLALVPAVIPVLARGARPLLRGAVKGSLVCLEKGQEAVVEIRKIMEEAVREPPGGRAVTRVPVRTTARPAPGLQPEVRPESKPIMAATGEPDPEVMG